MVVLGSRVEITLEVFERVAWRAEPVRVEPSALEAADAARVAFFRADRPTRRDGVWGDERLWRSCR